MIARRKSTVLTEGEPVTINWDPDEKGAKLVKLGPQQSEVKLSNGKTVYLPNKDLKPK